MRQEKYDEAAQFYTAALQFDPNNAKARTDLNTAVQEGKENSWKVLEVNINEILGVKSRYRKNMEQQQQQNQQNNQE